MQLRQFVPKIVGSVKDELSLVTGIKTQKNAIYTTISSDYTSISAGTNVDYIIIKKQLDDVLYNNSTDSLANSQKKMYPNFTGYGAYADNVANIGTQINWNNISFAICVAHGTYVDIAAARAALLGALVSYQLLTPKIFMSNNIC